MKKKGFTLIELLVVIAIIAMLLAILMPALNKVKKIAQRVVCGTNLKGLGTAQSVYANDYEDQFTRHASGATSINWQLVTTGWQNPKKVWNGVPVDITISSSLYLLVREADVSPKSFICGGGGQTVFDGKNDNNYDLVELWDFGGLASVAGNSTEPRQKCSYAYHMPYGKYSASGATSASFAMLADKNPWMDPKLVESSLPNETAATYFGKVTRMGEYFDDRLQRKEKWMQQIANTYAHGREGQNVVFGDGHSEYAKTTDVGVRHDGIYTRQSGPGATGNEHEIRCGLTAPNSYFVQKGAIVLTPTPYTGPNYQPQTPDDSLLMNDDD
jgi:prepilin-type N-terminal cleavage/methylation domain-containing protein